MSRYSPEFVPAGAHGLKVGATSRGKCLLISLEVALPPRDNIRPIFTSESSLLHQINQCSRATSTISSMGGDQEPPRALVSAAGPKWVWRKERDSTLVSHTPLIYHLPPQMPTTPGLNQSTQKEQCCPNLPVATGSKWPQVQMFTFSCVEENMRENKRRAWEGMSSRPTPCPLEYWY